MSNLNVIVGAIPAVLDVKVQERDIDDVIRIDLYQPLAILSVGIVFRVIFREYDARVGGESAAAGNGYASVTGVESSRCIRHVRLELDEHRVPEAGVHNRFRRITNFH